MSVHGCPKMYLTFFFLLPYIDHRDFDTLPVLCEHQPIQITVCGRFARSQGLSVLKISFDFEIEKVRTKIAVFGNEECMAAV